MGKLRIPRSFKEKDLNRSIYDLSQPKVLTMMQGLNIPVKFEIMKPKDEFTIDYYSMISSMPMVGNQLSDWKLRTMVFKSYLSNYYSWMDNNARLSNEELQGKNHHYISYRINNADVYSSFSDMYPEFFASGSGDPGYNQAFFNYFIQPVLPVVDVSAFSNAYTLDYETSLRLGVQPGSLLDMIEFPVGFVVSSDTVDAVGDLLTSQTGTTPQSYVFGKCFNADYILCYLDAVRNYLVNNQLDAVPWLAALPVFESDGSVTADKRPYIGSLSLKTIDNYIKTLRMQDNGIDLMFAAKLAYPTLDSHYVELIKWLSSLKYGGLFLAQYERDMLNGLLRTVNMEDVRISVGDDGSFSINDFRFSNRKQLKKDREGIAGGRWTNLLRTLWGVDSKARMDVPELVHTSSYYVSAKSVMSQSNTEAPDGSGAALGQLGGVFDTRSLDAKKCKIYAEDHCIMFAIVSLVPDVVYTNGLGKGLDILSFDDEYYPQFDALGFQDVPRYKYNALPKFDSTGSLAIDAEDSFKKVVGKNIAFIDLISNVPRAHGAFGNDQYFETWILKREFFDDVEGAIVDSSPDAVDNPRLPSENITSYVNPLAFQYPFSVQSVQDANFVFQIKFDIRAVRSKGKYFMPTLGK